MIDRKELVRRHCPMITRIDSYSPLSVGNGEFAFTGDITGLQTFPGEYEEGIPLCTQSQWGWHTAPMAGKDKLPTRRDLNLKEYHVNGRVVPYATEPGGRDDVYHWLRQNPHRLNLARIGLNRRAGGGAALNPGDIGKTRQYLDLWSGLMVSSFTLEGTEVETYLCCHPEKDLLAIRLKSELIASGKLGLKISFPYGSPELSASDWNRDDDHSTLATHMGGTDLFLHRILDNDHYFVRLSFSEGASWEREGAHSILFHGEGGATELELLCEFQKELTWEPLPTFYETRKASEEYWADYWNNGGIIDFSGSTDPRAAELERRVILSQYLMAIQCAGSVPPQETGLTYNSWFGKAHLEMHWWHGAHFPMWNRPALLERSLGWYRDIMPLARELAEEQGYEGGRWPKMVAADGIDSPSNIAPLLIWQQPHPIYFAELMYQAHPDRDTLEKYREIVGESAKFMASYVIYDESQDRYNLGPALIPAQENHSPLITVNPAYELEYWRWGLAVANEWKTRMGEERVGPWDEIAEKLADLPVADGVYLAHGNCPTTFTEFNFDHPSMLGALGILPGKKVDREIMRTTLKRVLDTWQLDRVWGWDFPMMAMTAARLGEPELALEALLYDSPKNKYLANGHNKQGDRKDLALYLPGNGGLLAAVALMAAGWTNGDRTLPGFPNDGTWKVRWEDLRPMI